MRALVASSSVFPAIAEVSRAVMVFQRDGAGDGIDDDVADGQGVLEAGDLEVWVGGGGVAGAEDDVVAGLRPAAPRACATFPVPRMAIFMGVSFREEDPVWMVRERLTWAQGRGCGLVCHC